MYGLNNKDSTKMAGATIKMFKQLLVLMDMEVHEGDAVKHSDRLPWKPGRTALDYHLATLSRADWVSLTNQIAEVLPKNYQSLEADGLVRLHRVIVEKLR